MEPSQFFDFVAAAERTYGALRAEVMARFALTAAEVDVLLFLANNPQYDTAAQIARVRRIPKSHVSISVAALAERGLLQKSYADGNRKTVHLALTDAAAPAAAFGREKQEEFFRRMFAGFSPEELAELDRLHRKAAQNLEKDGERA